MAKEEYYWIGQGVMSHGGKDIAEGGKLPASVDPLRIAELRELGLVSTVPPKSQGSIDIIKVLEAKIAEREATIADLTQQLQESQASVQALVEGAKK